MVKESKVDKLLVKRCDSRVEMATVLRRHGNAVLYIEPDSAALLD